MTSLVKALNAAEKDKVPETMETVSPRKAQAPTGKGLRTNPVIVERKIANNCQAWEETAAGLGTRNLTMMPTATEMAKGKGLAPCQALGGVVCGEDSSFAAETDRFLGLFWEPNTVEELTLLS